MTLEKNPNNEHYILNAATSCADGFKIKRHTICVAPVSFASVRFERDIDLPSNTRQQLSHMEAQLTAAEVLKPKDTDRSSSDGEDATLQPSTAHVADETDDALRRYAGAHA